MKKKVFAISLTAIFAASVLVAAEFWQTKKFTEWTEKEVKKMLESSPWAAKISVPIPMGGRGGRGGMGGGMSFVAQDEGGGMGGGRGGMGGGMGGASFTPSKDVFVRWHTALPVKQAIAVFRYGKEAETHEEAKKMLEREENFYVVGVAGVPGRGFTPEVMKGGARLNCGKLAPITPLDVQMNQDPGGTNIYLIFPRKQPGAHVFTVEDKQVEVAVDVPNLKFKKKFNLKDMVYNGKLEM
ncbi:MAG: hypothetical protein ACUVXB_10955 [Bryobacteraceae bacterium]